MKRFLILLAVLASVAAGAQTVNPANLYWVVETNVQQPNYSIVRFYNSSNTMVHEVRIDGVYINVQKAKYRKKLDRLVKDYTNRVVASSKKPKSRVDLR